MNERFDSKLGVRLYQQRRLYDFFENHYTLRSEAKFAFALQCVEDFLEHEEVPELKIERRHNMGYVQILGYIASFSPLMELPLNALGDFNFLHGLKAYKRDQRNLLHVDLDGVPFLPVEIRELITEYASEFPHIAEKIFKEHELKGFL